jgi:alanine dehydrogenase
MTIGCVKEIKVHEYRVGVTPDNVREYCNHGHKFLIEKDAGVGSGYSDSEYAAAGASIIETAAEVWKRADMLIKVKEPLEAEFSLLRDGQILFTYLHLAADKGLTMAMLKSGCSGVAYETIEDVDGLPCLKPMSEIAGRLSIQEGAKYLEKPFGGKGILLGGVPGVKNGKIVILGAGIVGTNALKAAVGIGADVTIMDISMKRLSYLDDLYGNRIHTLYSSSSAVRKEIADADLVVGAVLIPGDSTPKLVKREYLKAMKPGSVMVDVAIDQGGCFETSKTTFHNDPVYTVDGIVHYCVGNMPGAVPYTSTLALTNSTLRYGLALADKGLKAALKDNPGLARGLNIHKGAVMYKKVADIYNLPCEKLEF